VKGAPSDYLQLLQRGVDHIEEHLDNDIELADVARAAGLSRWHFQRIFRALTGDTLKAYIRSRRLAVSLDRLRSSDMRIIDIALAAGYTSQESYTRAFKQAIGVTPNHYRKLGGQRVHLAKVQFDMDYLLHLNDGISLVPDLASWPAMQLVGVRTTFYGADSEKNDLGEKIPALWHRFLPRLDEITMRVDGWCYGVIRQEHADSDRLIYDAAMEVTGWLDVPEGMVTSTLPAARWAVFTHRGPAADLDHSVNYVYSTWLAGSGHRHTGQADLEIYGSSYHPTSADSEIGYAIPIGGWAGGDAISPDRLPAPRS
jgi:AraC family transcriptional regulator